MALDDTNLEEINESDYVVKSGDTLYNIAKAHGYEDFKEFAALNADRYPSLLTSPGSIEVGWVFKTQEAPIQPSEPGNFHTVARGDTLTDIAEKFNTDVDTLVALNQDTYRSLKTDRNTIQPGWTLNVEKLEPNLGNTFSGVNQPEAITTPPIPPSNTPPVVTTEIQTPTQLPIETPSPTITADTTALQPLERPQAPAKLSFGEPETHTVVAGDTLWNIAEELNTDVATLVRLNKDKYPSLETNPGAINKNWVLQTSEQRNDFAINTPTIPTAPPPLPEVFDVATTIQPPQIANAEINININEENAPPEVITAPPALAQPNLNQVTEAFNNPTGSDERLAKLSSSVWNHIRTGGPINVNAASPTSKTLIIIDPGHNIGREEGAVSGHTQQSEVDVVDPVAAVLADQLRAKGFDVLMTRNPGEKLEGFASVNSRVGPNNLNGRAARADFATLATQHGGYSHSILLSIHADSEHTGTARGFVAYAGSQPNRNQSVDFGGRAIDPESSSFTRHLSNNVSGRSSINTFDATVVSRFDSTQPSQGVHVASLVELGYLSNRRDANILREMSENPEPMAQQLTSGIMEFYNATILPLQRPDVIVAVDSPSPDNV